MGRKMTIWILLTAMIGVCSLVLLLTVGSLSSELGWLYFSGSDLTPSNYFLYYVEQVLGWMVLASVFSATVWFITLIGKGLKEELKELKKEKNK